MFIDMHSLIVRTHSSLAACVFPVQGIDVTLLSNVQGAYRTTHEWVRVGFPVHAQVARMARCSQGEEAR